MFKNKSVRAKYDTPMDDTPTENIRREFRETGQYELTSDPVKYNYVYVNTHTQVASV